MKTQIQFDVDHQRRCRRRARIDAGPADGEDGIVNPLLADGVRGLDGHRRRDEEALQVALVVAAVESALGEGRRRAGTPFVDSVCALCYFRPSPGFRFGSGVHPGVRSGA